MILRKKKRAKRPSSIDSSVHNDAAHVPIDARITRRLDLKVGDYLSIQFPLAMTQGQMIAGLIQARKNLALNRVTHVKASDIIRARAKVAHGKRLQLRNVGATTDQQMRAMRPFAWEAYRAANKLGTQSAAQVMKSAERARGPGSDKMQAALEKRDAWARKRFATLLHDKRNSRPYSIEALQSELKNKNFGIWRGNELAKKTIRKIVAGINRMPSSK